MPILSMGLFSRFLNLREIVDYCQSFLLLSKNKIHYYRSCWFLTDYFSSYFFEFYKQILRLEQGEPCVLDRLRTSVEDIAEYYRQQGICSGEDCVRFMQQVRFGHDVSKTLWDIPVLQITIIIITMSVTGRFLVCLTSQGRCVMFIKPGFHYPSWRPELTGDRFSLRVCVMAVCVSWKRFILSRFWFVSCVDGSPDVMRKTICSHCVVVCSTSVYVNCNRFWFHLSLVIKTLYDINCTYTLLWCDANCP